MSSLSEVIEEVAGIVKEWPYIWRNKRKELALLLILVELRKLREELAPLAAGHTAPSVEVSFRSEESTISPHAGCASTGSVDND